MSLSFDYSLSYSYLYDVSTMKSPNGSAHSFPQKPHSSPSIAPSFVYSSTSSFNDSPSSPAFITNNTKIIMNSSSLFLTNMDTLNTMIISCRTSSNSFVISQPLNETNHSFSFQISFFIEMVGATNDESWKDDVNPIMSSFLSSVASLILDCNHTTQHSINRHLMPYTNISEIEAIALSSPLSSNQGM